MIFNVKVIVAVLWMFVATALVFACLLSRAVNITGESIGAFFSRVAGLYPVQGIKLSDFWFIGNSVGGTVVIFTLLALLGIMGSLLFFFTVITIGQLSHEHKIGSAVGAGIGLYAIQQISVFMILIALYVPLRRSGDLITLVGIANRAYLAGLIVYILLMAAEYAADMIIVKKHLNLQ